MADQENNKITPDLEKTITPGELGLIALGFLGGVGVSASVEGWIGKVAAVVGLTVAGVLLAGGNRASRWKLLERRLSQEKEKKTE